MKLTLRSKSFFAYYHEESTYITAWSLKRTNI